MTKFILLREKHCYAAQVHYFGESVKKWVMRWAAEFMIGIPGQTYKDLARDILTLRKLDLDMIGVGPFIPHPETPLGQDNYPRISQ